MALMLYENIVMNQTCSSSTPISMAVFCRYSFIRFFYKGQSMPIPPYIWDHPPAVKIPRQLLQTYSQSCVGTRCHNVAYRRHTRKRGGHIPRSDLPPKCPHISLFFKFFWQLSVFYFVWWIKSEFWNFLDNGDDIGTLERHALRRDLIGIPCNRLGLEVFQTLYVHHKTNH